MEFKLEDCKVEAQADGSITVKLPNGAIIAMRGSDIDMSLPTEITLSAVGIKNLVEVESYTINTIVGSRSHVVRFINGGYLQFTYNNAGQIVDLTAEKLIGQLTQENEMLYSISSTETQ